MLSTWALGWPLFERSPRSGRENLAQHACPEFAEGPALSLRKGLRRVGFFCVFQSPARAGAQKKETGVLQSVPDPCLPFPGYSPVSHDGVLLLLRWTLGHGDGSPRLHAGLFGGLATVPTSRL